MTYKIVFHGTERLPSNVFKEGFSAKDLRTDPTTATKLPMQINPMEGFDRPTAVCITPDFAAAGNFPEESSLSDTYIYCCRIDVNGNLVNAHNSQVLNHPVGGPPMLWHMREMAVKKISNSDVLAGFQIKRTMVTSGNFKGSVKSFKVVKIERNPSCALFKNIKGNERITLNSEAEKKFGPSISQDPVRWALWALEGMVGTDVSVPNCTDGFVSKSRGRKLTEDEFFELMGW